MIEKVTRKSMVIRPSGRSTDFISPSFGHGCLYNCSYCYMKRHKPTGLDIATNTGDILTEINSHCAFADVEKPNQTHAEYVTYDISCNEDFALHAKYHDWKRIFGFFKDHPQAMGSFATKYVNEDLLEYNPEGKIRIRFSLMPDKYSRVLEPNTTPIDLRIKAIDRFIAAGYDVHINFSPVIVTNGWLTEYPELFRQVNDIVENKDKVKAEVIFLTHNIQKHKYNLANGIPGEDLLWKPMLQQDKVSQYGGKNIRYTTGLKKNYIRQFTELHQEIIPWNTIRYIF
jgi:spore photoproduct lyase